MQVHRRSANLNAESEYIFQEFPIFLEFAKLSQ